MEQVPEKLAPSQSPDLLKSSRENLPPAEVKRITHQKAKRQAQKPSTDINQHCKSPFFYAIQLAVSYAFFVCENSL
jgi:hypothetical protein